MAIGWSGYPTLSAVAAVYTTKSIAFADGAENDDSAELRIRRTLQKHFLKYGVYLPVEDIIVVNKKAGLRNRAVFLMQKICGKGRIYVWVPLKMRLPIVGDRVFEWCWKPTVQKS